MTVEQSELAVRADRRRERPPRLREATFQDHGQISALEEANGLRGRNYQDWTRFWLLNPAFKKGDRERPIGWVLETESGEIVGSAGSVPLAYVLDGEEISAATGRAWTVAPSHRAFALMLLAEHFSQPDVELFVDATVNGLAQQAYATFGASRVPTGDLDTAAYWVTNYRRFAESALRIKRLPAPTLLSYPAGLALWTWDLTTASRLKRPASAPRVEMALGFDERFDGLWEWLRNNRTGTLLGVRDRATLAWHFGLQWERKKLWIFTVAEGKELQAYAIFQRRDDDESGLKRMRLVDFQTRDEPEAFLDAFLIRALNQCREEGIHTLEKVGLGLENSRLVERHAPHRRKLPGWPFYFLASDSTLATRLQDPGVWQPSSFDGDASL